MAYVLNACRQSWIFASLLMMITIPSWITVAGASASPLPMQPSEPNTWLVSTGADNQNSDKTVDDRGSGR
jgi:hypothetical protein